MKKIFLSIIMSITIFSCENFLTVLPEDSLPADRYYIDEAALRANTATLYGRPWFDFQCNFMWLGGDMLAGDLYYTFDQQGHFFYNTVGAGNSFNNLGWTGLYRVVSFANSIINDMPLPARANNISEIAIEKAIAEARFMRASAYLLITEYWGEVPIIANSTALITSSNPKAIYVNRHLKKDVYRFIFEDLEYAISKLPTVDQPGRVTSWSAKGMLAKAYLTRAAFEKSEAFYTKAKELSLDVIKNSGLILWSDYSTMFDVAANNSSESLFAIQCTTGGYATGNSRTTVFSRSERIADDQWGASHGPTRSLQGLYEDGDSRRQWVYMTKGDFYPNLDKENGGYTYEYTYRNPENIDEEIEKANGMLANVKKYCIGKSTDHGGPAIGSQDAPNNVYMLRLSDVYLVYVEACMGTGSTTSDPEAINCLNAIRKRASLSDWVGEINFSDLMLERRKEFALEGMNWFDIKRYYYRDNTTALKYLNDMERDRKYKLNQKDIIPPYEVTYSELTSEKKYEFENDIKNYIETWETLTDMEDDDSDPIKIVFREMNMTIPLPAAVTTMAPILLEPAIAYYND